MKVGIIETVDSKTVKLIGYGVIQSTETVLIEDIGVEVTSYNVALDDGNIFKVTDQRMAEDYIIKAEIDSFTKQGFTVT